MAEGPAGPNLHALGLLDGKQAATDELKVNEDEIFQIIPSGADKLLFTLIKFLPFLNAILPANFGKVSTFAGMETEGLAGKQIRVGSGGAQGGVLGKIAGDLMKNSAITDHTGGVGGSSDGGGGGGDGGGSGGGGSSGGDYSFDSYAASSGMGEMFIAAGGGSRYESIDMSDGFLGSLRPSFTPSMGGQGMGAGVEMG